MKVVFFILMLSSAYANVISQSDISSYASDACEIEDWGWRRDQCKISFRFGFSYAYRYIMNPHIEVQSHVEKMLSRCTETYYGVQCKESDNKESPIKTQGCNFGVLKAMQLRGF